MKKILKILFVAIGPCLLIVMLFYSRENIQNQSFKLSEVNIKTDQNQFVSRDLVDSLLYDYIVILLYHHIITVYLFVIFYNILCNFMF